METAHLSQDSRDITRAIIQTRTDLTRKLGEFDAILLPGDVSGLSVGVTVAVSMGLPFAIGRIAMPKCYVHGSNPITDAQAGKGLRYLYIDDQISSGQTFRTTVASLRKSDPSAKIVGTYEYQYGDYKTF
jgi:orotate phosphoribosyltransferase